jgi:ATP-independent RNA helicase DbpA
LGVLTSEGGIAGSEIGKIDIFDDHAYVAIKQESVDVALAWLKRGKIKGKSFMVRKSKLLLR